MREKDNGCPALAAARPGCACRFSGNGARSRPMPGCGVRTARFAAPPRGFTGGRAQRRLFIRLRAGGRRVLPSRHAFFSGVRGQKTPCAVSAVWPSVSAGIRAFLFFCLSAARLWAAGGKAAGKAPLGLVPRLRIAYPLSNLWDLTPAAGALPCAGPQRPAPVRALRRAVLYGRARGRPPYKGAAVRPLGGNAFFLSLLVTEWMIS